MMPLHDVDLLGIYFTPASVCLLVGVVLLVPARWLLDALHIDRFVWNRALFDLALLVAMTPASFCRCGSAERDQTAALAFFLNPV